MFGMVVSILDVRRYDMTYKVTRAPEMVDVSVTGQRDVIVEVTCEE